MFYTAGVSRANKKEENQDSCSIMKFTVGEMSVLSLAAADGISRGESSRWYADAAIQSFQGRAAAFLSLHGATKENELKSLAQDFMAEILGKVNADVTENAEKLQKGRGGCTLSAALVIGENLVITANAGDSPIFVIGENGEITNLYTSGKTVDLMVRRGEMTLGSDEYNRQSNRLSIYIGANELPEQASYRYTLKTGDRLIIGTDGAFDCVKEEAMKSILTSTAVSERLCMSLLDHASKEGAYDNQTLIICGYADESIKPKKRSIFGKGKS